MRGARILVYFALFFLALAVESLWFFPWNATTSCGVASALFAACCYATVRTTRRAQQRSRCARRNLAAYRVELMRERPDLSGFEREPTPILKRAQV